MTSPFTFALNGHRKFIAFILTASLAITGFAAVPAHANDNVGKVIAGLALLGIAGAVIHDAHKDRDVGHRSYTPPMPVPPIPIPPLAGPPHPLSMPKPMPHHVRSYDLPGDCLTTVRTQGQDRKILPQRCLNRNYGSTRGLPQACYITLSNAHQGRHGYAPRCLRQHGYRMTRR